MNSAKTIETSIFWQRYVLNTSKDPKQVERVRRAIEKLQAELNTIRGEK
jgi:hypothetical protein